MAPVASRGRRSGRTVYPRARPRRISLTTLRTSSRISEAINSFDARGVCAGASCGPGRRAPGAMALASMVLSVSWSPEMPRTVAQFPALRKAWQQFLLARREVVRQIGDHRSESVERGGAASVDGAGGGFGERFAVITGGGQVAKACVQPDDFSGNLPLPFERVERVGRGVAEFAECSAQGGMKGGMGAEGFEGTRGRGSRAAHFGNSISGLSGLCPAAASCGRRAARRGGQAP